jgi:hypothetical protein
MSEMAIFQQVSTSTPACEKVWAWGIERSVSPTKGDRVAVLGQDGTFVVYDVDSRLRCAELKLIGHDFALSTIPWSALTFLDEQ